MVIHRLEIENFASIRDRQVIDLRLTGTHPDELNRAAPLWHGASERAPKVVTLFGANASGKSNVLRALSFLIWFIEDSFSANPSDRLPFERFNDEISLKLPTKLAIHFAGPAKIADLHNRNVHQCRYVYEVVIDGDLARPLVAETIFYCPQGRKTTLFERRSDNTVSASKAFNLNKHRDTLLAILRPNASAISTLARMNHLNSKFIFDLASVSAANILDYRIDPRDGTAIAYYLQNPHYIENLNNDISRIDLGIEHVEMSMSDGRPTALFTHRGLVSPMKFESESHGTQQFIKIYPALLHVLEHGGLAVIDELDAAIHPLILPEILRWFHDPERNPHDAQLWMTCHNASLLEHLMPSEVLFCEKDSAGRTQVYGLSDIDKLSADDNFYRKYMGGMFGAVPQIG